MVFEADVQAVTPSLKLATVSRNGEGHMTFACDEGPGLVQAQMVGADTTLELESPDPPDRIARVVRNAERGCFVLQALMHPIPITSMTRLNGSLL
jgi:hypothetical protein